MLKKPHLILANLNGSTIIEVLIATALVGISLTGLALLMTNNVKNSSEADYREAAGQIAQDTLEKIRQQKETTSWAAFKGAPISACPPTEERFKTSFKIDCSAPVIGTDKVEIVVKVCWQHNGSCVGSTRSITTRQNFFNY